MKKHKASRVFLLILVIALTCAALCGVINARALRVAYLGTPFDRKVGIKLAYVSDLNISSDRDADRAYRMIRRLCEEGAEALLLNGVSAPSLIDEIGVLTGLTTREDVDKKLRAARKRLNMLITDIDLPGGVYATLADNEPAPDAEELAGKTLYLGGYARINVRGRTLDIFGFSPQMAASTNSLRLSNTGTGPMLVMFNSPVYYNQAALAAENRKGGQGNYFFLSGGTLDGQIRVMGEPLMDRALLGKLDEGRDVSGVYADKSGYRMLLSPGAGTRYLPIRLGTRPMGYLIDTGK